MLYGGRHSADAVSAESRAGRRDVTEAALAGSVGQLGGRVTRLFLCLLRFPSTQSQVAPVNPSPDQLTW